MPIAWVTLAIAFALALAVAGLVDQMGSRSLMDHAGATYAPHGKDADAALIYGLVYSVAALDLVAWLLVLRSARAGSRWAWLLTVLAILTAAALAAMLLGSREYGEQVFPTTWGILALLSPAAGTPALFDLVRRRTA